MNLFVLSARNHFKSVRFYVSNVHCRRRKCKVEIASMPGIFRRSIDLTLEEIKEIYALGIRAVNIYVKVRT
jgi:delta-aminolevulinic acid dehydratase/porphobilinogen synthase